MIKTAIIRQSIMEYMVDFYEKMLKFGKAYGIIRLVRTVSAEGWYPLANTDDAKRSDMMEESKGFSLKYLPMEVTLLSLGRAKLPSFLGSTLRGVIGQTLRRDRDAYGHLYYNRTFSGNRQDIVNPYIILPPQGKEQYLEGEELKFQILLLGDAVQYAKQLVRATEGIDKLGLGASRYPFKLVKIIHSLDQRIIWKDGFFSEISVRSADLPYRCLPEVRQLHVQILTPLRIRRNGVLLDKLDFPTLIRNITRRMEIITERYGGWVDTAEAERVQTLSEGISMVSERLEFVNMTRYSNRFGEKMDFSGLQGDLWFEGALTPYVPWLYAAQILHLGGNTTFGMGRIQIEFI